MTTSDMVLKFSSYAKLCFFISYIDGMLNLSTSRCILGIFPNAAKNCDAHR